MSDSSDTRPSPTGDEGLREGDSGLGVPTSQPGSAAPPSRDGKEKTTQPQTGASARPALREGESGLGIPEAEAVEMRELAAAELERYGRKDQELLRTRLEDVLAAERAASEGIGIPRPLRSSVLVAIIALAAVLGLLVVTQVTSALATIATLPFWSQYVILGALAIFSAMILYACMRLLLLYVRLRRSKRLRLKGLKALAARGRLQLAAREKLEGAARELVKYMEEYPLDKPDALFAAGLAEGDVPALRDQRRRLVERQNVVAARLWVQDFQDRFQVVIDKAAQRRVRGYATRAGVKTAASPFPLLDNLIILHTSLSMLGDLMRLYNLRVGAASTVWVLARVIGQAYLAGEMQGITEAIADAVPEYGGELGGQLLNLAKKVGSKVGEGAINGIFIHRLGRASMALLQPTLRE